MKRTPPKPRKGKTFGFSKAEIEAAKGAQSRAEASTPQAIVAAFAPNAIKANGFELERCYASTIILLTKTGSSLLQTEKSAEFLIEDIFKALVIFTRPIAEARELVKRGLLEAMAQEIADIFPPDQLKALALALNAQIVQAFSTLVPHGAKGEGEGSGNFPETAAAPGTAGS